MNELLLSDLKYWFWGMSFLGLISLAAMPFIGNDKSVEKNAKTINQFSAFFLLSAVAVITQLMFAKDPSSAGLFLKSIFLPLIPEEESKITQLQIPASPLIFEYGVHRRVRVFFWKGYRGGFT